jgi:hypothetical protein
MAMILITCNSTDGNNTSLMFSIQLDPSRNILGKVEITDEDVANTFTFKVVSDDTRLLQSITKVFFVCLVDYEKNPDTLLIL